MTYSYGEHSRNQSQTLHPYLREILKRALETDDHRIEQGARPREEQWAAFRRGASKVTGDGDYPHMIREDGWCYAADIWPYINGKRVQVPDVQAMVDTARESDIADDTIAPWMQNAVGRYCQFIWLIRKVQEVALVYFAEIEAISGEQWEFTTGTNWDKDPEILTDQGFDDYPHIQIRRIA